MPTYMLHSTCTICLPDSKNSICSVALPVRRNQPFKEDKSSLAVQGHPEEVYACEFLDQSTLLTASADRLFLWDMDLGACVQEASCTPGPLHQGKLSYACSRHVLFMTIFNLHRQNSM